MYHVCVCCLRRPEKGVRFPGLELRVVSSPSGAGDQTEEQTVFLPAEPSVSPLEVCILDHRLSCVQQNLHLGNNMPTLLRLIRVTGCSPGLLQGPGGDWKTSSCLFTAASLRSGPHGQSPDAHTSYILIQTRKEESGRVLLRGSTHSPPPLSTNGKKI